MPASVTEWVLAGQQTAVCKHHKGKHQSTRDFFIEFFVVCKHFLKTDPQRLSKVKKKMPFPSWVEGEGKDRGQSILLPDSLSSTGPSGRTIFWKSVQKGALFSLVSQAQLCPVSEEPPPRNRGWLSLCGSEEVSPASSC